jgi:hypothetical protein
MILVTGAAAATPPQAGTAASAPAGACAGHPGQHRGRWAGIPAGTS